MRYQNILFEISEGCARLTLNRPEKLNSFTEAMHAEIADALSQLAGGDSDVRVLVISGAGRAFCAGQDLSEGQMSAEGDLLNVQSIDDIKSSSRIASRTTPSMRHGAAWIGVAWQRMPERR